MYIKNALWSNRCAFMRKFFDRLFSMGIFWFNGEEIFSVTAEERDQLNYFNHKKGE